MAHAAVFHDPRDLRAHPDRAAREPTAERLGERDDVRLDAEALHCSPRRDGQAGLDLVEDQHDAVAPGDVAHRLQIARLGKNDPDAGHHGLEDEAGGPAAAAGQAPLQGVDVIEVNGVNLLQGGRRDPRAPGQ